MRGRDGDDDARLADLDAPQSVVDGDRAEAVALGQLVAEPGEHRLGHLLVGLVLEMEYVAAARAAAPGADEAPDRSGLGTLDLPQHRSDVERAFDEAERAAADGRDERDLV